MSTGDWTTHDRHATPSPDCHLCHSTRATLAVGNVDRAEQRLLVRFRTFTLRIHVDEREHFFHPCNADAWVREFARWLDDEQKDSAEVRASND